MLMIMMIMNNMHLSTADNRLTVDQCTYVNWFFLIGWLIHGIIYLTGLFLLISLTHLKLDWHSEDIVYDLRAQLQGTGSRSEVLCEKF